METHGNSPRIYKEDFYFVDDFHGNQCVVGCEAHTNFADESACLMAISIRNEGNHNSQITGGVENAVPVCIDIFH
jgi:hypothetical protein